MLPIYACMWSDPLELGNPASGHNPKQWLSISRIYRLPVANQPKVDHKSPSWTMLGRWLNWSYVGLVQVATAAVSSCVHQSYPVQKIASQSTPHPILLLLYYLCLFFPTELSTHSHLVLALWPVKPELLSALVREDSFCGGYRSEERLPLFKQKGVRCIQWWI